MRMDLCGKDSVWEWWSLMKRSQPSKLQKLMLTLSHRTLSIFGSFLFLSKSWQKNF